MSDTVSHHTQFQRIAVIGAGAWGTALAQSFAANGAQVLLWAYEQDVVDMINATRQNDIYLQGITLDDRLTATSDMAAICACDVIVLVPPTQHVARIVQSMVPHINSRKTPILIASKGIEISTGRLVSHIVQGLLPENPIGVLTGPSFAIEVAKGLPAALTLAMQSAHESLAYQLCEALATPHFRLYVGDDVIGAQIAGAVKNVIAIACGIAHGKEMGDNARAALLTRGLAEMVRLGQAMGADAQTFLGLSGVGDLTLTCNAMQSRNFSLGVAIGKGARAADVLAERSSVAEGYYTAEAIVKLAGELKIEMPICTAVYETLHKDKAIDYIIKGLLQRPVSSDGVAA